MRPAPKPEKRETGRTKGARENGRSQAWKSAERETARWLQEHAGVDPTPPVPPSSTGRVGHLLRYDSTSAVYIGECKRRGLPKWVADAWAQIIQLADQRGDRHPMLVLAPTSDQRRAVVAGKSVRLPEMHVITPKRHAELLRYEADVRGETERSNISRNDICDWVELTPTSDRDDETVDSK